MIFPFLKQAFPNMIELFVASCLYISCLKKRDHFLFRLITGALFFVVVAVLYSLAAETLGWEWFLAGFFVITGVSRFCCRISWRDAFYCADLAYATEHLGSSLFILMMYRGTAPEWSGFLYYLIFILVYAACYWFFARTIPEDGQYGVSAFNAAAVSVVVLLVALFLSLFSKRAADTFDIKTSGKGYVTLFLCCQVYDIVACSFLLLSQRIQRMAVRANTALEKSNLLWQQNERQYELSKENVELINRKCHDLRHQIAALSDSEAMSERRKAFIKEIQGMVDVYDSKIDTGNEALNMILMEKGLYCKVHDIQWSCVADGKILDFMDVVDLYTLIGNALDNAIESVEKIPDKEKRIIAASIWRKAGFGMIQIRNYFEGNIELRDGLPVTSKGDTENHGFGLRSMRKIVEKYQGTLSVKTDDHQFLLYIMIPLE